MMSTEQNLLNIIELMRRDDSTDAPADSIRWASNLFRSRAAEPKVSLVRRLAAVLQMELAPGKAAFGERSASTTQVRQMLFKAEDNAIDLRIEPSGPDFIVRGQILGEEFAGANLVLHEDERRLETVASDASEFVFEKVPAGRYELLIRRDDVEISLRTINIE